MQVDGLCFASLIIKTEFMCFFTLAFDQNQGFFYDIVARLSG
jgi:hypothetical protein